MEKVRWPLSKSEPTQLGCPALGGSGPFVTIYLGIEYLWPKEQADGGAVVLAGGACRDVGKLAVCALTISDLPHHLL